MEIAKQQKQIAILGNHLGKVNIGTTDNQGLLMGLIYLASGHSTKTVGGDSSLEASTQTKEGATGVKN